VVVSAAYGIVGRWREIADQLLEKRRRVGKRCAQFGQQLQAVAQTGELARAHALEREAGGDPFHVGKTTQRLVRRNAARDGIVPRRKRCSIAQRVVQAVAQQAGAHAGRAFGEER
jgi:hypothetical protein